MATPSFDGPRDPARFERSRIDSGGIREVPDDSILKQRGDQEVGLHGCGPGGAGMKVESIGK
jgi:hypothetical protein